MSKLFWLVVGIALGAVLGDLLARTPKGRVLAAAVDEVVGAFADGYRRARGTGSGD